MLSSFYLLLLSALCCLLWPPGGSRETQKHSRGEMTDLSGAHAHYTSIKCGEGQHSLIRLHQSQRGTSRFICFQPMLLSSHQGASRSNKTGRVKPGPARRGKKSRITLSASNAAGGTQRDSSQLLTRIAFADTIALTQLRGSGAGPESNGDEIRCGALGSLLMRGEGKLSKNTKRVQ